MTTGTRRFVAALFYVACTVYAHHVAFARIQKFVELGHFARCIDRRVAAAAIPLALDGLVRTDRGVYELRMDLSDKPASDRNCSRASIITIPCLSEFYIEAARRLPECQKFRRFADSCGSTSQNRAPRNFSALQASAWPLRCRNSDRHRDSNDARA